MIELINRAVSVAIRIALIYIAIGSLFIGRPVSEGIGGSIGGSSVTITTSYATSDLVKFLT